MNKKIPVLVGSLIVIALLTFLGGIAAKTDNPALNIFLKVIFNYAIGGTALIAMKLTDMRYEPDLKNKRQYVIGISIGLVLSLCIAFIPALLGTSLVGQHKDFSRFTLIYSFLFYMLVIGPVEELVFRVYVQDTFTSFSEKNKPLGVLAAALVFGFWHFINGRSIFQVIFTFMIGSVFGLCRYFIKDCKYAGLAVGHGLYDFLNEIVRMFIAK